MRLTKNEATEATDNACPASLRRCSPRRYASAVSDHCDSENSSVTLTCTPRAISSSIAPIPAVVPGTFTIRFGRSTRRASSSAISIEPSVSWMSRGGSSSDT